MNVAAILAAAVLLFWPLNAISQTQRKERVQHTFTEKDDQYTFKGSFFIKADPRCLLNMLFAYDHIRNYFTHVDHMERLEENGNTQTLAYTYKRMFHKSRSIFRRTLNEEEGQVNYELTGIDQNGLITPDIQSIKGYYGISPEDDGYRVTFYQEGVLDDSMLKGFYFNFAEDQATGFLQEMKNYAEKTCGGTAQ